MPRQILTDTVHAEWFKSVSTYQHVKQIQVNLIFCGERGLVCFAHDSFWGALQSLFCKTSHWRAWFALTLILALSFRGISLLRSWFLSWGTLTKIINHQSASHLASLHCKENSSKLDFLFRYVQYVLNNFAEKEGQLSNMIYAEFVKLNALAEELKQSHVEKGPDSILLVEEINLNLLKPNK